MIEIPASILLLSIIILLLIHALLVACEMSLVKIRYRYANGTIPPELRINRRVSFLIKHSNWVGSTIRFLILMVTLALGFSLIQLFANGFIRSSYQVSIWEQCVSAFVAFLISVIIVFILAHQFPRRIALSRPLEALHITSWFVAPAAGLILPLYRTLSWVAKYIMNLFGIKAGEDLNILDHEVQIRALNADDGDISPEIQKILKNTLRFKEYETMDVLLPRTQVQYLDLTNDMSKNLELARKTGHTRFPLCSKGLDDCVGIIHIKDLFHQTKALENIDLLKIKRDIISFSDETPLESTLRVMLAKNIHMALIRDEFGGVVGVITLEGILERIVGEIQDEFDEPEIAKVSAVSAEVFEVDGLTPLHELEESMDLNIPDVEAATFGGLITEQMGRLPRKGETLSFPKMGFSVTVNDVSDKRIISASISVLKNDEEER